MGGLKTNNHFVDTAGELLAMISQQGVDLDEKDTKKRCADNRHAHRQPENPSFSTVGVDSGIGMHFCFLAKPEDDTIGTCAAKPKLDEAYQMKQRVCYCQK